MELFHLLNRGVDKRTIFMDGQDYARFVHDMYQFNDTTPTGNAHRLFKPPSQRKMDLRSPSFVARQQRNQLVDIHGWCLMKNHYHLLLSERVEGGITRYIRKLNIGYAKYFNERHNRSGALFQGRTKKILIESDTHELYILHYIHLNPLDHQPQTSQWREGEITNAKSALAYLGSYRWSSYCDYIGVQNFPSILTQKFFRGLFKDYTKAINEYVTQLGPGTPPQSTLE